MAQLRAVPIDVQQNLLSVKNHHVEGLPLVQESSKISHLGIIPLSIMPEFGQVLRSGFGVIKIAVSLGYCATNNLTTFNISGNGINDYNTDNDPETLRFGTETQFHYRYMRQVFKDTFSKKIGLQ
ncbi:uncharacterized protein Bfra_006020 [Botrytis fragariae]|uniref:Uncharacterized protein n=1 Tax=Botrytis fragariae TaxID=1964551 RepID=A0A8H6EHR5_9HELO|nr:uncharacterized protein Bfra_006020 [Botrytis fragariae]KAF5872658.1 hypothetical protein Bfra_006020 [Botrytis fragariae]